MSESTLWQIDYDHPEMTEKAKAWFEVAKVKGVLAPMEPDQDSAIIALLSPATVKAIGVSMSYNQAKKIVRVVLVGAGIGDK